MADTEVENNVSTSLDDSPGLFGPYWIDPLKGLLFYFDNLRDLRFSRTTDGGVTWNNTLIQNGNAVSMACWFDQETPGDTGTLVHVVWLDSGAGNAQYVTVDIDDASVGTIRTIDSGLTVSATEFTNRTALTKTVGGNLVMALKTSTELECYRSVDDGVNWVDRANPFESTSQNDWLLLYPANTGDNQDVAGIFWDNSATTISIKMYDDSANTWTETTVSTGMTNHVVYITMDAAVRHSDNHIILASHNNNDSTTDDLLTWDLTVDSIASPTVTAKTNIFDNQAESSQAAVIINQQNDDIYFAHINGSAWLSMTDVVFHKSTDGMTTWGTEQSYNQTTDDNRLIGGTRTIADNGGRIQWSWFNDDLNDIYINLVNDIEIAAAAAGWTGKINGVTNPAKINGILVANITKVNGVASS